MSADNNIKILLSNIFPLILALCNVKNCTCKLAFVDSEQSTLHPSLESHRNLGTGGNVFKLCNFYQML